MMDSVQKNNKKMAIEKLHSLIKEEKKKTEKTKLKEKMTTKKLTLKQQEEYIKGNCKTDLSFAMKCVEIMIEIHCIVSDEQEKELEKTRNEKKEN